MSFCSLVEKSLDDYITDGKNPLGSWWNLFSLTTGTKDGGYFVRGHFSSHLVMIDLMYVEVSVAADKRHIAVKVNESQVKYNQQQLRQSLESYKSKAVSGEHYGLIDEETNRLEWMQEILQDQNAAFTRVRTDVMEQTEQFQLRASLYPALAKWEFYWNHFRLARLHSRVMRARAEKDLDVYGLLKAAITEGTKQIQEVRGEFAEGLPLDVKTRLDKYVRLSQQVSMQFARFMDDTNRINKLQQQQVEAFYRAERETAK